MTYSLRFIPDVEEDVMGGFTWYEEKAVGLGEEFLRTFYAGASGIPRNPTIYPKIHNEFRRRLLKRFPYAIYFTIEDHEIVVFGLFHCARDPHTIRGNLHDRVISENP
jgi:plasmid stabilization system protein ParE